MIQPFVMVVVSLLSAYILSEVFRKLGMPRLVGQVIAGIVLGIGAIKYALFSEANMEILSFLANLGAILLFYYVGLETNLKVFTKNIRRSVLISIFNTSLPLILGFLLMKYVFQFNNLVSALIGVALSVSAQSASLDLLDELKMLKSRIGNMVMAAGAVDDVIELFIASILLSLLHFAISPKPLQTLVLDTALFLLLIIIIKMWLLPSILKLFDRENSSTARFTGAMIIVLVIASLSEFLGIGALIGAMIAGMIIRQTIYKDVGIPNWEEHDIARSIHIIAFGFLIPLFFVWIGVNTNISFILQDWKFICLLLLIATVGTVGGTSLAILLSKGTLKEGISLGWGLNPKGDIELVIAALALKSAIITPQIFTSLVAMSLATTIISPIIFKKIVAKR